MACAGKHIHGLDSLYIISLLQDCKVAGEGFGIAGYVHKPLGLMVQDKLQKALFTSGAGRVGENYIHMLSVLHLKRLIVGAQEVRFDAVQFCIAPGICHGIGVDIKSGQTGTSLLCRDDSHGADPAVGVEDIILL